MTSHRIISADSHIVEPPELWSQRIDSRFRDRAPRVVKGLNGQPGEYFICENIEPLAVASSWGAGATSEELVANTAKGYSSAPASVWDPAARLKEQDQDGVSAEVLYTSFGMFLFGLQDAELRAACFRTYNDFVMEYCSHAPNRLLGMALITLEDIPAAIAELERCAKGNLRGAMISSAPPLHMPYSLPHYEPFWAAAQALKMPLSMHALTGSGGARLNMNHFILSYMALPLEVQQTLATLVLGGVFERFPELMIVFVENDASWLPHFMYRLDHVYERYRFVESINLALPPSDYVKRNVRATFQFETQTAVWTSKLFGADGLMWSSDYPHNDSTWPRSREFIANAFAGLSDSEMEKIVGGNAAKIYRI